jgi:hypothetical protein
MTGTNLYTIRPTCTRTSLLFAIPSHHPAVSGR